MTFKMMLISCMALILLAVPGAGFCQNKVVVIPLMGKSAQNLHNVVTVAKKNGDFIDPVAAVNSITDASEDNPFLVVIGPGVYDIGTTPLVMKPYVSISGSGREVTTITGKVPDGTWEQGVVLGADNVSLTDLTVESTGESYYSVAIFNKNASPRIDRVAVRVEGAAECEGIYNTSSSPILNNVEVIVNGDGAVIAIGVFNKFSSSPIMEDMTIAASGALNSLGVYNFYSAPSMMNLSSTATGLALSIGVYFVESSSMIKYINATAFGGYGKSCGIHVHSSSVVEIDRVTAIASDEVASYGICSSESSVFVIQNSDLKGSAAGLYIRSNTGEAKIINNKIVGGVINEDPDTKCRGNYDQNLNNVDCTTP